MFQKFYIKYPFIHTRYWFLSKLNVGKNVLDVGAANGAVLNIIKKFNPDAKLFAVDISNQLSKDSDIDYFFADMNDKLPFENEFFDVIVMTQCLEHLDNSMKVMQELSRVLKKKGMLYIETPSTRSVLLPSLFFLKNKKTQQPFNFYDDPTHIRPYGKTALVNLFCFNNFKVLYVKNIRQWLYFFLFPIIILLALIFRNREIMVHAIYNMVGWSNGILGVKK